MMNLADDRFPAPSAGISNALFEAFRPGRNLPAVDLRPLPNARLWREDAIHRAKNLSQIAASLSSLAVRRFGVRPESSIIAQARELAMIYEELGAHAEGADLVPCAELLERLSRAVFGLLVSDPGVTLRVSTVETFLTGDQRRALLLIASELTINSLKYAFPDRASGQISIELIAGLQEDRLVVEDNGVGPGSTERMGEGSNLIGIMTGLLGGRWRREARPTGGTMCTVEFPHAISAARSPSTHTSNDGILALDHVCYAYDEV